MCCFHQLKTGPAGDQPFCCAQVYSTTFSLRSRATYSTKETVETKIDKGHSEAVPVNMPGIMWPCARAARLESLTSVITKNNASGPRAAPTNSLRGHGKRLMKCAGKSRAIGSPTSSHPTNERRA